MLKLAVIGKDAARSLSPQIHNFIAKHTGNELSYGKISISQEAFGSEIGKILDMYDGINITIPFKLAVIPYLKKIYGDAADFGAVNTVLCKNLTGYNTDGEGFMMSLGAERISLNSEKVLVLGAGGAGRSVAKKLCGTGAEVSVYDRHFEKSLSIAENSPVKPLKCIENVRYGAIINATGTGAGSTEGQSPVSAELINLCGIAIDLIYNPVTSKFLQIAKDCGKKIVNGMGMLFFQAYLSQCLFFGKEPSKREAEELFNKYAGETE